MLDWYTTTTMWDTWSDDVKFKIDSHVTSTTPFDGSKVLSLRKHDIFEVGSRAVFTTSLDETKVLSLRKCEDQAIKSATSYPKGRSQIRNRLTCSLYNSA